MHTHRWQRSVRTGVIALVAAAAVAIPAATVRGSGGAPEKPDLLQVFAARRAAAANAPRARKDPAARPATSEREPAWPAGIIDSGQAPFPGSVFAFQNQWQGIVRGEHATVYAGAFRDHPMQGVVALDFTAMDVGIPASAGGVYPTPTTSGAVHIVSESAGVLTLVADGGTTFRFDVAARTFAAS